MTDLLGKISPESDGAQFLVSLQGYRDNVKLKQTVEGLQKAARIDGRVHTTFQQGGSIHGASFFNRAKSAEHSGAF